MTTGWRDITPELVDKEIKSAMIRNEIENYTFTFKFISKFNKEYQDKVLNFNYYKENTYDHVEISKRMEQYLNYYDESQK